MKSNLDTLCFIREQTSFEEDYKGNFGFEVVDRGNRFFVLFESVLQSFGVKNRNGRKYDMNNIWNCIQTDVYIQDQLRKNCWMGEADHPEPEFNGQELTMQRLSKPAINNTSHYVRKPRLEGNLLVANIQTDSSTDAGMNMAIKIVDGKIIPCFSARVFGALQGGVVNVRKLIAYDWVLFPSHPEAEARITQPVMESVDQEAINTLENETNTTIIFFPELAKMAAASSRETNMLCESFGLTEDALVGLTDTGNSVVLSENGNTFVQPITDSMVRSRNKSILTDWLNG